MAKGYPRVEIIEEGMREGMQIEDAAITVADKIRLLDQLSGTGLKHIVVGSFVSPKFTPQMANVADVVRGFEPQPGVKYTALIPNARGQERASEFADKITMPGTEGRRVALGVDMCDTFSRRNWNRSQAEGIARWPEIVETAKKRGATETGIGANQCWGSNFSGTFTQSERMEWLTRQHGLWGEAGIEVTSISLGDSTSFCMPHVVEEQILAIKEVWPAIKRWSFHLHDARGMAVPSIYAALRVLEEQDSMIIDTTIGGIGGCPYCGNGRATGMAPTEDVVVMLEAMGIDTGIDIKKLVECVWTLEEILARSTMGHVSKAGWLPEGRELYDPNMPFIETHEQARHFISGPAVYEGAMGPWGEPIVSAQRAEIDRTTEALREQHAASR